MLVLKDYLRRHGRNGAGQASSKRKGGMGEEISRRGVIGLGIGAALDMSGPGRAQPVPRAKDSAGGATVRTDYGYGYRRTVDPAAVGNV
jgi:hypothetical protein